MSLSVKGNTLRMYGVVGEDFTAEDVMDALDSMSGDITVKLQSPGGIVGEGHSIHNQLREYDGAVNLVVDSLAASIASVIMMAGDRVAINENAVVMVHNAWAVSIGNARSMREVANVLDTLDDQLAGIYAAHTGKDAQFWREAMDKETYFTAAEAVEVGLANELIEIEARKPAAAQAQPVAKTGQAFARRDAILAVCQAHKLRFDLKTLGVGDKQ